MIEIYLMTSLAPIPLATVVNREIGSMGQNYFRSLLAVGEIRPEGRTNARKQNDPKEAK